MSTKAPSHPDLLRPERSEALAEAPEEPPVVARMVVEIRSDGSRTIARGALEDAASGERVVLEAHGTSPMALAATLAKSLLTTPLMARQVVRAWLRPKK
jgi:hypothetical protein